MPPVSHVYASRVIQWALTAFRLRIYVGRVFVGLYQWMKVACSHDIITTNPINVFKSRRAWTMVEWYVDIVPQSRIITNFLLLALLKLAENTRKCRTTFCKLQRRIYAIIFTVFGWENKWQITKTTKKSKLILIVFLTLNIEIN